MKCTFIKLSLIILSGLFSMATKACICDEHYLSIDSLGELKKYDFIAHVKITGDQDYKKRTKDDFETIGLLTFQVLELFKGEKTDRILEYDKNSSCDIGISNGEEWILFGKIMAGKLSITACERDIRYKERNGQRDWNYNTGLYELKRLRELFQHKIKKYENEKRKEYYSNGQPEIEETYKNGLKNGVRKIWYPNGVLFCRQYFINDTLDGKSEWFYPSGQLYDEDFYIKGKHCNVSRMYYDSAEIRSYHDLNRTKAPIRFSSNTIQVQYEIVFDSYGWAIISREYTRSGKIYREETIDPDRKFRTVIYYHDNGAVSSIMYSLNGKNHGHYQEYEKNGFPGKAWDYDEEGNVIRKKE